MAVGKAIRGNDEATILARRSRSLLLTGGTRGTDVLREALSFLKDPESAGG